MLTHGESISLHHLTPSPSLLFASPNHPWWYYSDWEGLGVCVRVEIGSKDVANKKFVLADLANKVKHENGRLIAKRKFVSIEELPDSAKEVVESVKAISDGKRKRGKQLAELAETSLLNVLRAVTPIDLGIPMLDAKGKKRRIDVDGDAVGSAAGEAAHTSKKEKKKKSKKEKVKEGESGKD